MENSLIVIQLDLAMKSNEASILIRNQQGMMHYTSNYYKHVIYYNTMRYYGDDSSHFKKTRFM